MNLLLISLVLTPPKRNPEEPDRNGKNPEEIGIFTIYLVLISLSILFLGGMIAYLWMKYSLAKGHKSTWAFQKIYEIHWLFLPTSFTLLLSLFLLRRIIQLVRKNIFSKLSRSLKHLWFVGIFFLIQEIFFLYYFKDLFISFEKNIFLFIFFLLTSLHNFHFLMGMFFLSIFVYKAKRQIYNSKSHSDLKYLSIYWTYLVFVWFCIYLFISFF